MFGPGFVWLVALKDPGDKNLHKLAILNTYIAGSPYPAAHSRQQGVDMNTVNTGVIGGESAGQYAQRIGHNHNSYGMHSGNKGLNAGFMGNRAARQVLLGPGSQELEPIMCVNTWEHVWMIDRGVGGKTDFLNAFWNLIDWNVVSSRWSQARQGGRRGY